MSIVGKHRNLKNGENNLPVYVRERKILKDKRKSFDTLENSVKYAKQLNKYRLSETKSKKVKMKKYGVNSSME